MAFCIVSQVDKTGYRIRRSTSFPLTVRNKEDRDLQFQDRSVYVGGFDKKTTSLDDLIDFFENRFDGVINVHRRVFRSGTHADQERGKLDEAQFLGSVFVTFGSREAAEKFLEQKHFYQGKALVAKFQRDFLDEKVEYNDTFDPDTALRTVWVHGFDREVITQEELADFFAEFEGACMIKKRRLREKKDQKWRFTGSVFVTFDTIEYAEQFLALKSVKCRGDSLKRMSQVQFYKEKKKFGREIRNCQN